MTDERWPIRTRARAVLVGPRSSVIVPGCASYLAPAESAPPFPPTRGSCSLIQSGETRHDREFGETRRERRPFAAADRRRPPGTGPDDPRNRRAGRRVGGPDPAGEDVREGDHDQGEDELPAVA